MTFGKIIILVAGIALAIFVFGAIALAATGGSIREVIRSVITQRLQVQRGGSTEATSQVSSPAPTVDASSFVPDDIQVGDPKANYYNVEVSGSFPYLIWIEGTDRAGNGIAWHCGINPDTGNLTPADCRGFKAFDTTVLNRPNIGIDSKGIYYVGADRAGHVTMVRPSGPTTGTVTKLSTPPDTRRRGYYASSLPDSSKQYILWVLNSDVAGGGTNKRNTWEELQYIDVADPTNIHSIERQNKTAVGRAPLDIGFFRWVQGAPLITFGSLTASRTVEVKQYDVQTGKSEFITDDGHIKVDPYSWVFGDKEVLLPGIDVGPLTYVYTRPLGASGMFDVEETIVTPEQSLLAKPSLAQSNQPIVWKGKAYTAYQVNDAAAGDASSFLKTLALPGEIWLSTVFQTPQKQWLISGAPGLVKNEPEPFTGKDTVYVFYSAAPQGASITQTTWQLRRASTPLRK